MPTRTMNGEALWSSTRVERLPEEWVKDAYCWMHSLALDDGSFECDSRMVWHKCYSGIRKMTVAEVAYALDCMERERLLFRWLQVGQRALPYKLDALGNHAGKVWGYWTNIDRPGRLPAKSDRRKVGPGVPQRLLERFLNGQEKDPQMKLGERPAAARKRLAGRQAQVGTPPGAGSPGIGLALDREREGVGLGKPGKNRESAEVSAPPSSSSPSLATPTAPLASAPHPPAGRKVPEPAKKNTLEDLEQKKRDALERVRKNLKLA